MKKQRPIRSNRYRHRSSSPSSVATARGWFSVGNLRRHVLFNKTNYQHFELNYIHSFALTSSFLSFFVVSLCVGWLEMHFQEKQNFHLILSPRLSRLTTIFHFLFRSSSNKLNTVCDMICDAWHNTLPLKVSPSLIRSFICRSSGTETCGDNKKRRRDENKKNVFSRCVYRKLMKIDLSR